MYLDDTQTHISSRSSTSRPTTSTRPTRSTGSSTTVQMYRYYLTTSSSNSTYKPMVGQDIPRSASPHSTMTDKGENKKGENKKEQRVEVAVLDGDLQGPALTWLSTASQGDAVAFFRHMGEDIGHQ